MEEGKSPKGESPRQENGNGAGDVKAQVHFELDELRQRAGDLKQRVAELIRERPVVALLVAAGAGYLLGRILRA
jgi:ElaB/YqjD/DUF883 family membrane-anchored ribosome-binding protein